MAKRKFWINSSSWHAPCSSVSPPSQSFRLLAHNICFCRHIIQNVYCIPLNCCDRALSIYPREMLDKSVVRKFQFVKVARLWPLGASSGVRGRPAAAKMYENNNCFGQFAPRSKRPRSLRVRLTEDLELTISNTAMNRGVVPLTAGLVLNSTVTLPNRPTVTC